MRSAAIALFLISMPVWAGPVEELEVLYADEWEARLNHNPVFATFIGADRPHDRMPDVSPEANARRLKQDKAFLARLQAIDIAGLTGKDAVNAALFRRQLTERIDGAAFDTARFDFYHDSGFHTGIIRAVEATPQRTEADYRAYLRRLSDIPRWIDQNIANMRRGIATGWVQPEPVVARVLPTFQALEWAEVEQSPLWKPFADIPDTIGEPIADNLRSQAKDVMASRVLPAFAKLTSFMEDEYQPAARKTLGATKLPDGDAYYAYRLQQSTTLDLSAEEIHQLGLSEAKRIRARMDAIIEEVGFEGDFQEFLAFLRTDDQFYAKTANELLREAAWISKRVDEMLPAWFATLPRQPYGVREVPADIAPGYTTGRYWPGVPGVRGGLFMVNTYNLKERPLYTLPALAVHEGVPGHHLQGSLAREQGAVPNFRRYSYITAFGEGWGLYCEELGEKMGVYETPYERFGRLTYEMWRAGRLIVDTGIHAMGWTRDEAVAFFVENSALARHNIEIEVDRYISWPAQAVAYKIGEQKILELRGKAEQALGDDFDIRYFHDVVLGQGAVTLPLLEQAVDRWIADQSTAS